MINRVIETYEKHNIMLLPHPNTEQPWAQVRVQSPTGKVIYSKMITYDHGQAAPHMIEWVATMEQARLEIQHQRP